MRTRTSLRLAVAIVLSATATTAPAAPRPQLLVSVTAQGGLCPENMCHWDGLITTATISGDGRRPRRITASERRALVAAIAALRPAKLPPFAGTCPIAYDGQERLYRFRGQPVLKSCTNDLSRVRAVLLADRLLASLRAR